MRYRVTQHNVPGISVCTVLRLSRQSAFLTTGRKMLETPGIVRASETKLNVSEKSTANNRKDQLIWVYQNAYGNFELLALLLMRVCCKREHMNFDEKK